MKRTSFPGVFIVIVIMLLIVGCADDASVEQFQQDQSRTPEGDILEGDGSEEECTAPASCDGNFLVFCDEGVERRVDCSEENRVCAADQETGELDCLLLDGAGGGSNAAGSPRFMTLPLSGEIKVLNAWQYTAPPNAVGVWHLGMDYKAAEGTDLYAVCSGVAMTSSQYANGYGYGKFIMLRCDNTDPQGLNYFAMYGHVKTAKTGLKTYTAAQRSNTKYSDWTRVLQGEKLGTSGKSDTTWAHLHFEVFRGGYCQHRTDPYDLYKLTTSTKSSSDYYPPEGTLFGGCGPNHLWTECPPVFVDAEDCPADSTGLFDSIEDQDEVCRPLLKVEGRVADGDGLELLKVVVDSRANCSFSKELDGELDTLAFEGTLDLAKCGLTKGEHTLSLWAQDSCGFVRLVKSIRFNYQTDLSQCQCDPKDYVACNGRDVYWFDTCDRADEVKEACPEGTWCLEGKCEQLTCSTVDDQDVANFLKTCQSGGVYFWPLADLGMNAEDAIGGQATYTYTNGPSADCRAEWRFPDIKPGKYRIQAHLPSPGAAHLAKVAPASITYDLHWRGGLDFTPSQAVNQSAGLGTWVTLTEELTIETPAPGTDPVRVVLRDNWFTYSAYIMVIDAMKICRVSF